MPRIKYTREDALAFFEGQPRHGAIGHLGEQVLVADPEPHELLLREATARDESHEVQGAGLLVVHVCVQQRRVAGAGRSDPRAGRD